MSEPFIGQVVINAYKWAPMGWAFCHGQSLPTTSNAALYSVLGSQYGGDGRGTHFSLPDFRSRVPVGTGYINGDTNGDLYVAGTLGGQEEVVLTKQNIAHIHEINASANMGNHPFANWPEGEVQMAGVDPQDTFAYGAPNDLVNTSEATISSVGKGFGHNNMQPSLCIHFAIALVGVFPSRN